MTWPSGAVYEYDPRLDKKNPDGLSSGLAP